MGFSPMMLRPAPRRALRATRCPTPLPTRRPTWRTPSTQAMAASARAASPGSLPRCDTSSTASSGSRPIPRRHLAWRDRSRESCRPAANHCPRSWRPTVRLPHAAHPPRSAVTIPHTATPSLSSHASRLEPPPAHRAPALLERAMSRPRVLTLLALAACGGQVTPSSKSMDASVMRDVAATDNDNPRDAPNDVATVLDAGFAPDACSVLMASTARIVRTARQACSASLRVMS
jgi:hypothetical protein